MLSNTKYRKLLSEEIIENSEYPEITAPMVRYRGDRGGKDLTFDWSCISKPFAMNDAPHTNNFDRFMLFAGTNLSNFEDFQAEVEVSLGKEGTKKTFTEPKLIYIPRGLVHGPINFKKINTPIAYANFYLSPEFSKEWVEADYEKYIVKPIVRSGIFEIKSFSNGNPFREQKIPFHQMIVLGKDLGVDGANFCLFYYAQRYAHVMTEPTHLHKFDMWIINLGGDPMNVEELNAEIEMWWGEENQKLAINTATVCHVIPGLIHRSIDYRRVDKPFIQIHTYNQPYPQKDEVIPVEGGFNLPEGVQG